MKQYINTINRSLNRQKLILKKNSPHISFALGIAGVLTGTVLACKATFRVVDVWEDLADEVEDIKNYSPDLKKDLVNVYYQTGTILVKEYASSAIVLGLSITALTSSHLTLTKRNNALSAAYIVLNKAYSEYRDRVRERLGVEEELDIYHAVISENKKDSIKIVDPTKLSPYSRFFDESSTEWVKDAEINKIFITCQQNYLNHKLQAHGHVFLNEVYDALGMERSSAGAVVGWVISDNGDNYIDFGLYSVQSSRFVNGNERSILLDFNVDGVIYDKIGRRKHYEN